MSNPPPPRCLHLFCKLNSSRFGCHRNDLISCDMPPPPPTTDCILQRQVAELPFRDMAGYDDPHSGQFAAAIEAASKLVPRQANAASLVLEPSPVPSTGSPTPLSSSVSPPRSQTSLPALGSLTLGGGVERTTSTSQVRTDVFWYRTSMLGAWMARPPMYDCQTVNVDGSPPWLRVLLIVRLGPLDTKAACSSVTRATAA